MDLKDENERLRNTLISVSRTLETIMDCNVRIPIVSVCKGAIGRIEDALGKVDGDITAESDTTGI